MGISPYPIDQESVRCRYGRPYATSVQKSIASKVMHRMRNSQVSYGAPTGLTHLKWCVRWEVWGGWEVWEGWEERDT